MVLLAVIGICVFYCRSYCPIHPEIHKVVFDLADELAPLSKADAFHVAIDEVFVVGEDDCPV